MGSALLDSRALHGVDTAAVDALRFQIAERLAAHRDKRERARAQIAMPPETAVEASGSASTRAARIAAVVAERYAQSPSYGAFLAAEAERAVRQAQAAAEVAALNAQAVVAAQQRLLESLSEDGLGCGAAADADVRSGAVEARGSSGMPVRAVVRSPRGAKAGSAKVRGGEECAGGAAAREVAQAAAAEEIANGGLTVRLYDDAGARALAGASRGSMGTALRASGARHEERSEAEARALDEEIAFRRSPVFEEPAGPAVPLPANLIEFPRQLVAPRKARPRHAEGPLGGGAEAPGAGQLRIFEVDPGQISTTPAGGGAATPQWTSIWLDAPGVGSAERDGAGPHAWGDRAGKSAVVAGGRAAGLPEVASIGRRMGAASIDGGLIFCGLLGFAATFVWTTCRTLAWQPRGSMRAAVAQTAGAIGGQTGLREGVALAAIGVILGLLYLVYQGLFFSLSGATPGMRWARIGLCTFTEENPTRAAMRRRVLAELLSIIPLGLGMLWAALDEERLSWHDRLSGMYQRSY